MKVLWAAIIVLAACGDDDETNGAGGGGNGSGLTGTLVYHCASTSGDIDIDLFTSDADGANEQRLTATETGATDMEQMPAWSPDGKKISFAWTSLTTGGIRVFDTESGELTTVTSAENTSYMNPTWSPDGASIAYATNYGEGGIYAASATGGEPYRMSYGTGVSGASDSQPAWSPDGDWIAYTRWNDSNTYSVYVQPVSGGDRIQVTSPEIYAQAPAWAPDSESLVVEGTSALYTVNKDGSSEEALPTFGDNPMYSPNGSAIVYDRTPNNATWEVFTAKKDGTDVRQVTNGGSCKEASWKSQ